MTKEERAALRAAVDYHDAWNGCIKGTRHRNSSSEHLSLLKAVDALNDAAPGWRWNGPAHAADCDLMQPVNVRHHGDSVELMTAPMQIKCTCGSDDDDS